MNTKLSPNVLIRNMKNEYQVVDLIYLLGKDRTFVLHNKICWNQRMTRGELVTALTMVKVTGFLHSRFGATRSHRYPEMIPMDWINKRNKGKRQDCKHILAKRLELMKEQQSTVSTVKVQKFDDITEQKRGINLG